MTLLDCNVMIVCSMIANENWNICLDSFLSKFLGEEVDVFVHQLRNQELSPRYDYIDDGASRDKLLSPLEVLKCELACWWILN